MQVKALMIAAILLAGAGQLTSAHAGSGSDSWMDGWNNYRAAWTQGKSTHVIDIDNDSLLLQDKDGLYTSGSRYTLQSVLAANGQIYIAGWRIGQDQYTPTDIKLPPEKVGPPDHPYAAWLYTGWFAETQHSDGRRLKLGFDIGCIGPCAGGEQTQKSLHNLLSQPLPQGWSRQVKNEAGLVLYVDGAPTRWALTPTLDLTPNLQARFGNIFTDAAAGATLRFGRLNLLPQQDTLHGFARFEARAVGYDASLQGGYFSRHNPHTVQPKRGVGEVEIGMAWNSAPFGVRASIIRRSNEIRDFSNSLGAQNFARLQFVYALR